MDVKLASVFDSSQKKALEKLYNRIYDGGKKLTEEGR